VSKNNGGGLRTFRRPVKVTRAYELPHCRQRCPVRLYELYNSLCPSDRPDDALYLRPLQKAKKDQWFSTVPVGVNTISSAIGRMCSAAGFVGFFSNHSLRATAATRLFDAGVDEQLIKLKTGHSSDAVRNYKRVSDSKLQSVTDVIASKSVKVVAKIEDNKNDVDIESCNVSKCVCSTASSDGTSVLSNCHFAGPVYVNIYH